LGAFILSYIIFTFSNLISEKKEKGEIKTSTLNRSYIILYFIIGPFLMLAMVIALILSLKYKSYEMTILFAILANIFMIVFIYKTLSKLHRIKRGGECDHGIQCGKRGQPAQLTKDDVGIEE